ncbi:methyl-accepting chemotaxis protein [Alicyclobacillus dauci]|uniref:Methyl-accepting chemotaxis protein n=1 Tax=Alicyclobacillus dauci TaxID=1475485 RepID=A0ABY6Z5T8_9BACL|nr:methyl-accepting chemotaxis protein [Alicyclobacillus dauci]WAH37556.1 methyl-accepting chemotaxis protein [Alicyclobacillus dauci]
MNSSKHGVRLSTKVLCFVLAFFVVFLGTVITSISMSSMMGTKVESMSNRDMKIRLVTDQLYASFYQIDDNFAYFIGLGPNPDKKLAQEVVSSIDAGRASYDSSLKQMQALYAYLTPQEKSLFNKMNTDAKPYLTLYKQAENADLTNYPVAHRLEYEQTDIANSFFSVVDDLQSLQKLADTQLGHDTNAVIKYGHTETTINIILAVIGFVIGVLTAFYIRRATRPLQDVAAGVLKIAEGDFTGDNIHIKSKDEIGQLARATNYMKDNLGKLIIQVTDTSQQVAAAAEELTASAEETSRATEHVSRAIQEVAVGTDRQAKSTEESESTIKGMSLGIQRIASNTESVVETASHSSEFASQGASVIEQVRGQMNSINETIGSLAQTMSELDQHSQAIDQVVRVITEIAAQTNLLSLNAAIEAARAGEHGRGFAVVASQVRKLAEGSADSAQEIVTMIKSIQTQTKEAVQTTEAASQEVAVGIESMNTAGSAFTKIQQSVEHVVSQIQDVSATIHDLSMGSEQVVSSITTISEVAAATAAGTQEVSASSEEQLASLQEITASASTLSTMAEELQGLVAQFRV